MRITDLLDRRSISLDGAPTGKKDALDQMVELMARRPVGRFWNDRYCSQAGIF